MPWFSRADRTPRRGDLLESAVGPSTSLSGIIKSDGGLRIDGHFEGHIDVGGSVVVGEAGVVSVDVLIARNITVGGIVKGNIECGGRLEILSTGQVVGDIVADAIMIDQGGVFQGSSRMRTAMPALPAPAATASGTAASPGETVFGTAGAGMVGAGAPGGATGPSAGAVDDVIIDLGLAAPSEPASTPPATTLVTPAVEAVDPPTASTAPTTPSPAEPPRAEAATRTPATAASAGTGRAPSAQSDAAPIKPQTSSRRGDSEMEFALDIEPVIPDTDGGSASGAVRQPTAPAAGDRGPQRNRRPNGGRRR